MLAATLTETCPNCGKEWPSRFGKCPCNMHRAYIHNNAIVVDPGASLLETVKRLTRRFYDETSRSAEYANLGDYDSPYPAALGEIDAVIGHLKHFRRELQALSTHGHDWSENDHCTVCGADGRA